LPLLGSEYEALTLYLVCPELQRDMEKHGNVGLSSMHVRLILPNDDQFYDKSERIADLRVFYY